MINFVQNNKIEVASSLLQVVREINTARIINAESLMANAFDLLEKHQMSSIKSVAELLEKAKPHIRRIEAEIQEKAPYFNVFKALGVTRKEVIQSRFLAYILSPLEDHNQGAKILNVLLKLLRIQIVSEENYKKIIVSTEHPFADDDGNSGRMDIVIRFPKEWIVVIENKIDANECVEQLARYRKWLDKQMSYVEESKRLIFLTPTGHESVTGKIGSYSQMSYIELANIFENIIKVIKQPSVRTVIGQYITTCHSIGGVNMIKQDNELQSLIKNPTNILAALEIEQQVAILRKNIASEFIKNIALILQKEKINPAGEINNKWKALPVPGSGGNANVEIRTAGHNNKPNYRVVGEYIFAPEGGKGWCGWYRPSWIDPKLVQEHETAPLSMEMIANYSGRPEGWWIGSNALRGGLLGYVLSDTNDIVNCLNDNQNDHHPLAREIAEELWTMFDTYREKIEGLDSFKANI